MNRLNFNIDMKPGCNWMGGEYGSKFSKDKLYKFMGYNFTSTLCWSAPHQTKWAPWSGVERQRSRSSHHWRWPEAYCLHGLAIFWRSAPAHRCCQLLSPPGRGETRRRKVDSKRRRKRRYYSDSWEPYFDTVYLVVLDWSRSAYSVYTTVQTRARAADSEIDVFPRYL